MTPLLSEKQIEALRAVALRRPFAGIKGGRATGFALASRNRTIESLRRVELIDGNFGRGTYGCRAGAHFKVTAYGQAALDATSDRVIESRADELRTWKASP